MQIKEYILAIESSCDDTAAAVMDTDFNLLSTAVASQKIHAEYGGVVPELASRAHQSNIIPTVDKAIRDSGLRKEDLSAVAFTCGPGLLGSLLVGAAFAKSFAVAIGRPLICVNHLEAHVLAHFIKDKENADCPQFPFLCLLVSGGNTQIIFVKSAFDHDIIGRTIDDAAGEAIDKAAKILSLPYPGGPQIEKLAMAGDDGFLKFGNAVIGGYDYSFSGLKTSILYTLRDKLKEDAAFIDMNKASIAASVQKAVIDALMKKFELALKDTKVKTIAIAGGVSANKLLQQRVKELGERYGCKVFIPKLGYSTDNAAMVAAAAVFKYNEGAFSGLEVVPYTR
ncbi:MAG: tRNA (adenosine(37)-N6)-threonylcarbamoyltransferase complex transferase subunit TsaD [Bacteroidales bacterium]|jgi:N6-L-threonylcarbamoyladenine synthase|nr:tRNA (adenosine(37)-N6)-threonylcarbamoyltransferase complex transferase subunit TsaD [Bacteroidales bacterium]